MIYFISQILKSVFDEDDHSLIEEELNRIFRTNAFNLIKRRHDEDLAYQKYPALKEAKYDSSTHGVSRIIKRLSIHRKFNYSVQVKPENTERLKKPLEIHLSPLGSVKSRSPLISSFYPSEKQKLFEFGKSARDKEELIKQARVSTSFFYRK
jgi:protein phosphatase 1 regulatory subunit 36